MHVVLVPDLGELVAGGPQFVDEVSRRRVVTPLRCQGAEIRDKPGRRDIVGVRWRPGRTPRPIGEPPPHRLVGVVGLIGEAAETSTPSRFCASTIPRSSTIMAMVVR